MGERCGRDTGAGISQAGAHIGCGTNLYCGQSSLAMHKPIGCHLLRLDVDLAVLIKGDEADEVGGAEHRKHEVQTALHVL